MKNENIFTPADILLPPLSLSDAGYEKYAVIACDQFTSEPEYWRGAEKIAENSPSALDLILPEAYLGTDAEAVQKKRVADGMKKLGGAWLKAHPDCMIYVERTLPDGKIRRGLVGKIDLEAYDYSKGSTSPVRATEATVIERIPPRVAIRREASVELPHVMLLLEDALSPVIEPLAKECDSFELLYDFELMLGGGHIKGYAINGKALDRLRERLRDYEDTRSKSGVSPVIYAVGDGNHSLASAKAHYEDIKKSSAEKSASHPARYALVEAVSLHDSSLEFEPIYRIVSGCDEKKLIASLKEYAKKDFGKANAPQELEILTAGGREKITLSSPVHSLTVGSLQIFLDEYLKENDGVCDYIHGEASLSALSEKGDSVGFLFGGMSKGELFPYVEAHGSLPRKTFSMGEAKSKRYYIEARKIV